MNEEPSADHTTKDICLASLLYLNLGMAGDMESVVLLGQLIDRWRAIEWNNPQFIAASEQMRGSAPLHPPDMADMQVSRATIHTQSEMLAERDEVIATALQNFRRTEEALKKIKPYVKGIAVYVKKMADMNLEMRHQLELLNADTSSYVIPELPEEPNLQ